MTRHKRAIIIFGCGCFALGLGLGAGCTRLVYSLSGPEEPAIEEVPVKIDPASIDTEQLANQPDPDATDGDDVPTDTLPHLELDEDSIDYAAFLAEMPNDSLVRLHVNPIGGTLGRVFNDNNDVHLQAAQALGIEPIVSIRDAWQLRRPIRQIRACRYYALDELRHSLPFLVPEAADLLLEIGSRFNDSLAARGGGHYRIKVTSLLRTESTIKRLRRVNRNSITASAHRYGTTFDISYSNFACDSSSAVNRSQADLKNLLGEILNDLRQEGRCYVKYERRGCFHITTRPTTPQPSIIHE